MNNLIYVMPMFPFFNPNLDIKVVIYFYLKVKNRIRIIINHVTLLVLID